MATKPGDRVYQIISLRLDAETGSAHVHLRMGVVDTDGDVAYAPSTTEVDLSGPESAALVELVDRKLQADGANKLQSAARLPTSTGKKTVHQREVAFAERIKAAKDERKSRSERPLTPHPPGAGNG